MLSLTLNARACTKLILPECTNIRSQVWFPAFLFLCNQRQVRSITTGTISMTTSPAAIIGNVVQETELHIMGCTTKIEIVQWRSVVLHKTGLSLLILNSITQMVSGKFTASTGDRVTEVMLLFFTLYITHAVMWGKDRGDKSGSQKLNTKL